MSKPWMKFYPADWQADPALRSCGISARGVWVELLCLMQKSDPVGYLLVNGKAPRAKALATLCGASERETQRALKELENAGVYSRTDDGVIFSRRMVRDEEKAARDKANGATGGNPGLKAGVNPPVKPTVDDGDKAQKPEARIQKEEPPTPLEGGDRTRRRKSKIPIPDGFPDQALIAEQQQIVRVAGADVDVKHQAERFRDWALANDRRYADWTATFRNWIRTSISDRPTFSKASGGGGAPPSPDDEISDRLWKIRLEGFRGPNRVWVEGQWGPRPGAKGCRVPAHLLETQP